MTTGTVDGSRNDIGQQDLPSAGRVLLVDDSREDAELLVELLAPLKTSIVVADSAEEALEILDNQIVDLVVTDLNMPGASGLDLARELQGRHDAPAVIFVTGSQRADDKVAAFALGALAYLQKPVDVGLLIGIARDILRSRCAGRTIEATVGSGIGPASTR